MRGMITLYPTYGGETHTDTKTKNLFRNLPCKTEEGFEVFITLRDDIYQRYSKYFLENAWEKKHKFIIWGTVKSLSEVTKNTSLSNLYIKADFIELFEHEDSINLFSINAHLTKSKTEEDNFTYYKVAENKAILNEYEKKNKSSTYAYVKTNDNSFESKDIMQGTCKLICEKDSLLLEGLFLYKYTSCKEISDLILSKKLSEVV